MGYSGKLPDTPRKCKHVIGNDGFDCSIQSGGTIFQAANSCEAEGPKPTRGNRMNLSPPSQITLILSVLLAVLALLVRYAGVAIPVASGHSFETMLAAFLLLLAGVLFRGF